MSKSSDKGVKVKGKNDTWSEKELSRHITTKGSSAGSSKLNKTAPESYGSPKARTSASSRTKDTLSSLKQDKQKYKTSSLPHSPSAPKKAEGASSDRRQSSKDTDLRSSERARRDARKETTPTSKPREHDSQRQGVKRTEEARSGTRGSSKPPPGGSSKGHHYPPSPSSAASSSPSTRRGKGASSERGSSHGSSGSSRMAASSSSEQGGRRNEQSSRRSEPNTRRDERSSQRDERERRKARDDDKKSHHSVQDKQSKENSSSKSPRSDHIDITAHTKKQDEHHKISVHDAPPPPSHPRARGGRTEDNIEEDLEEEGGIMIGGSVKRKQSLQEMVEVEEDGYSYEEDFDSYSEDFEEEGEGLESNTHKAAGATPTTTTTPSQRKGGGTALSQGGGGGEREILELMQAVEAENQLIAESSKESHVLKGDRLGVAPHARDSEEVSRSDVTPSPQPATPPPAPPPSHKTHMNFSLAQKRSKESVAARRVKKRGRDLQSLIELDIVSYDMFDLSPLSEYEVYVKKFGSDDARQVSVQTGEDNVEIDTQTDPISHSNVWVQCPPEDLRGFGREEGVEGEEGGAGGCGPFEDVVVGGVRGGVQAGQSSVRLVSFLKNAGQICSVLLEENLAARGLSLTHSTQSPFPFCTSVMKIQNVPPDLADWHVCHAHINPSKGHLISAAYSRPPEVKGRDIGGVVCVWNVRNLAQPNIVLSSECAVRCCCFSPQKASLVFAGGEDGSVVLWDLREPSAMHRSLVEGVELLGRPPTFSTAGIPQLHSHQSPVVSISAVSVTTSSLTGVPASPSHHSSAHAANEDSGVGEEDLTGLSFQLASLDRNGVLKLWVVVELVNPDPHGSDSDLGLIPGGRVKLVKSASVNLTSGPTRQIPRSVVGDGGSFQVCCFQFHPSDPDDIYAGTDTGCVLHHTRYGRRAIPRLYLPPGSHDPGDRGGACDVTAISFCPWQPDHFLVGCSDGSVRLHHTKRAHPVHCWLDATDGVPVGVVKWAGHCPGLFLILDTSSHLYVWDIIQDDSKPVFNQTLQSRATFCTLTSGPSPSLLLAYSDGAMELHYLKSLSSEPQVLEQRKEKLIDYLNSIM